MKNKQILLIVILAISIALNVYQGYTASQDTQEKVTSDMQAIELLKSESFEIESWMDLLSKSKTAGTPSFTSEKVDEYTFQIHAFESKAGHTATKGWYFVDTRTGRVTEQVN